MKDLARWLVLAFVVILAGGAIYYQYQHTRPCAEPIAYSIGAIDPRFGIATSTVVSEIAQAAQIWDTAAGKQLFAYSATGALKVNLVYDSRQATAKLGEEITASEAQEEAERKEIEAERAGVTPLTAPSFNAEIASYNASVDATNVEVRQYNQGAGHTFEEGEFIRDSSGERINIYEYTDAAQLERVLAHELGHAVGLGHNTNPDSIMYAENESGNLVPTADDLAALKAVCGSEITIK